MMALKSRMVEFKAEGGPGKGYLASPEKLRGGVLILHAWWGLNDFFKGFANRLASQGFLALAPDLYDGPLATSVVKPDIVGAVVVFYGSYPIDFSKSQASYLGHYAPDDEWEPVADVRATEEKIRGAGRDVAFHFYPGTKHWFVEENRPVEYNREASDLAWKRTLEFLDSKLR